MWLENETYVKNLKSIISDKNIPFEKFSGKTIFVTGATGLIGKTIVNSLLYGNLKRNFNCKVVALVRDLSKAKEVFQSQLKAEIGLKFVVGDVLHFQCAEPVDYVIHAASDTSSKNFVEKPVEVVDTIVAGTRNLLDFAKNKKAAGFIYLSTMEVYGAPQTDEKIFEAHENSALATSVRSSYPLGKSLAENLCVGFYHEYKLNTYIARLTQTIGCGTNLQDNRVIAQFARCAIRKENIVLHTKGETKHNYVDVSDAVRAIFTILLKGEPANAYNVANEETYCSIYEMAKLVADKIAKGEINVVCEGNEASGMGYAPTLKMNLSTAKIQSLGWRPNVDLEHMFINAIS